MARNWNPNDLPLDFKMTWHHFPDTSTVGLDASGNIAWIDNRFTGVPAMRAGTTATTGRQTPTLVNGFSTASGPKSSKGIIMLGDLGTFPQGNADRYMLLIAMNNGDGGVMAGYNHQNGGSNWWFDADFVASGSSTSPGKVNAGAIPSKKLHAFVARHKSGITTLRVDGVQKAQGPLTITGAIPANQQIGIRGCRDDYYTLGGCTLCCIYGKRDATNDENFLLEAWSTRYTQIPIASDNPYALGLPQFDDGATRRAPRSFRFL